MYNRYVRNDAGTYERIPSQEPVRDQAPRREQRREAPREPQRENRERSRPQRPAPPPPRRETRKNPLADILGKLHLDGVDSGDLLLLAILFLLFRDGEDEELLMALGLLLIL